MNNIDGNNYTGEKLRMWLRCLNMPTSGNKAALVLRLNAVPAEIRGICPDIADLDNDDDSYEDVEVDSVPVLDDREIEAGAVAAGNDAASVINSDTVEIALLKREMAVLAKEKELLKKENELLKKATNVELAANSFLPNKTDFSFATLKDLVPEYDGSGHVNLWVSQLINVGKMCTVTDDVLKALLLCKLKGSAQAWLHSKPDYVSLELETLIAEIQETFKPLGGKLQQPASSRAESGILAKISQNTIMKKCCWQVVCSWKKQKLLTTW